jgi:hypothetical protein
MPDTRTVKNIFNWIPLTKRSQGRPKYRWEDNIKQAICDLKIKNWIACVCCYYRTGLENATNTTPHGNQRLHVQWWKAPDDGHSRVRNM